MFWESNRSRFRTCLHETGFGCNISVILFISALFQDQGLKSGPDSGLIKQGLSCVVITLRWRHNGRVGVSNHQPNDCLLKRLFRRRSKKTSKLRVTGLCAGNSPVNSPHKWPVTRKMFAFDEVIMDIPKHFVKKWRFQVKWSNLGGNIGLSYDYRWG